MTVREVPVKLPGVQPNAGSPFGVYVHVPFCITRCGYCDFNTYTPAELGGVNPDTWLATLRTELELAAARLVAPTVNTVFVGGGTPSLLGGGRLATLLDMMREHFVLAPDVEVSTEANPESTWPEFFETIRAAGYTRISLGMQSVAPRVLAALGRVHSPGRALTAAREAVAAGFEHVNLDLIYGTPGESDDDLVCSVDAALEAGVDHISAYALVVEDGTALVRRIRCGELTTPDEDVLAHRYELVDARLSAAGLSWYEVSNWSRPGGECRHNLGYWNGGQWWGVGPGAHSYVGTTRWWNVKHPKAYSQMLGNAMLPIADFEQLGADALHTEDVLLKTLLRQGIPLAQLRAVERKRADDVVAEGLLVFEGDSLVLTLRGRLLADAVVRTLLG
ncbi:radical SAM family heme chaperone HemW [Mycobacterium lepromatosis]|uniref:Heme chaperone HemW n=1 Tax=Mycobacterium lepromatosis TaxID=480418 RepID=A0A0F4ERI0_9MYCO|nr:radical SAM family heme chaperone HemW [Mycobacterium lepromatosis]KJX75561.1 coproporphyrinogen III oxidase [Mycobacterium lepromatosis]